MVNIELLNSVPKSKRLVLVNNTNIHNLTELHKSLNTMSNSTFSKHVNEEKNDFYDWVKKVYKERSLANDILDCATKEAMAFCIKKRVEGVKSSKISDEKIAQGLSLLFAEEPELDKKKKKKISPLFDTPSVIVGNGFTKVDFSKVKPQMQIRTKAPSRIKVPKQEGVLNIEKFSDSEIEYAKRLLNKFPKTEEPKENTSFSHRGVETHKTNSKEAMIDHIKTIYGIE